jgi:hypothetical protein
VRTTAIEAAAGADSASMTSLGATLVDIASGASNIYQ